MIAETYQEQQQMQEDATPAYTFATVGGVYNDGISLIFPGSEQPSEKHYRANLYCKFSAGQRVYLAKDSGTYVVLFPVGIPGSMTIASDSASTASKATTAETATKATTAETATSAGSAAKADSATKSTTADKWTNARTLTLTGAVTGSASIDGSGNVSMTTSMGSSATVTNAKNFTEKHTGSTLAFFGLTGQSRKSVAQISGTSSATTSTIATKVNEIIKALVSYGLFK